MISKLVTAPVATPVSVSELKEFLRIDNNTEDTLLERLLKAAVKRLEAEAKVKFVSQVWDIFYDSWPASDGCSKAPWWDGTRDGPITMLSNSKARKIELPFGPTIAVTNVSCYADADDAETVMSASEYSVDLISMRGRIALRYGSLWPSVVMRPLNGVRVRATVGFGAAADVPEELKQAVLITAVKLYENRGDVADDNFTIPNTALALLNQYAGCMFGN